MGRRVKTAPTAALTAALAAALATCLAVLGLGTTPAVAEPPPPDITGPSISFQASPAAIWNGWRSGPVDVTVRVTDVSGVADTFYTLTGAQTGTGEPLGSIRISAEGRTTITISASDNEGNGSTESYTVGVDLSDPTIQLGGTIADGATVPQHASRTLEFGCADAHTEVSACYASHDLVSGGQVPTFFLGPVTLTVTAVDRVGRTRVRSLSYTVVERALQVLSPATVTGYDGQPRFGDVLHAGGATFEPAAERVDYEWLRGNTVVGTGADYTVAAADVGQTLLLRATGHRTGYAGTTPGLQTLGQVQKASFAIAGDVTLVGTPKEGAVVRIEGPTSVTPAPTSTSYEWGSSTAGTTTTTEPELRLTGAHVGGTLDCTVRYESATHVGVARCDQAGPVRGKRWKVLTPARVKGTAVTGRTVRAKAPLLSGTPDRLRYRWLRDGKPVRGATGRTLRLRASYAGHRLAVRVIATTEHRPRTVSTSRPVRVR